MSLIQWTMDGGQWTSDACDTPARPPSPAPRSPGVRSECPLSTVHCPLFLAVASAVILLLTGCAAPKSDGTFTVPVGAYGAAIDATRDTLRDYRFDLDRVDAAAGVVTTAGKWSSGLATPWDAEQSTIEQEWDDTMNRQQRRVRVTFAPADGEGADDLRTLDTPLVGRVEVTVYRMHRQGWRLESESIGRSRRAFDPELGRSQGPRYLVPIARDERLEARIAEAVARRIKGGAPHD